MKKSALIIAVLAAATVFLAGCGNIDPSVKEDTTEPEAQYGEVSEDENAVPEYINADALARRSYELCYLLGQDSFNTPDEISVNALVQYSFCHLYYDNLTDMPRSGSKLRQASVSDISGEIERQFGAVNTDITKADLYNGGKQCFEMWEPLYGRDIYYKVSVSRDGDHTYKVRTAFYGDSEKNETVGKTVLTVEDVSGQVLIKKLTSSK
ncbi:MAG: hypothetical protein PUC29_08570 [Clostridia bacterium]|nr:hypothetical protein [Clostridia bacterium]